MIYTGAMVVDTLVWYLAIDMISGNNICLYTHQQADYPVYYTLTMYYCAAPPISLVPTIHAINANVRHR